MPLFQGARLEDGRYLGLTVREVTALPHVCVRPGRRADGGDF